jgi:hypothetical protein
VSRKGSKISIVEQSAPVITIETAGGVSATLTDQGGGEIELSAGGTTITINPQGVSVQTGGKVSVQASQVDVSAGMVKVDAAMSTFSGMVKCDVLQASTVISSTYTPGAGNVW